MKELTYEEVLDQIEHQRRFGNRPGAEVSALMLEKLGRPQQNMSVIHIAGTNGKGSVSAFLCSILKEAGIRTGMFTSPHLVDFRERICVDGQMISCEEVTKLGNMLLEEDFGTVPTMFDYCLAMALLYYRDRQCQAVVIETGLGGRLDSTNAIGVPEVTVVTKIGYDHMAVLGDTLDKIAAEKAGIIKKGTKLVLESQKKDAMDVLLETAEKEAVTEIKIADMHDVTECRYENEDLQEIEQETVEKKMELQRVMVTQSSDSGEKEKTLAEKQEAAEKLSLLELEEKQLTEQTENAEKEIAALRERAASSETAMEAANAQLTAFQDSLTGGKEEKDMLMEEITQKKIALSSIGQNVYSMEEKLLRLQEEQKALRTEQKKAEEQAALYEKNTGLRLEQQETLQQRAAELEQQAETLQSRLNETAAEKQETAEKAAKAEETAAEWKETANKLENEQLRILAKKEKLEEEKQRITAQMWEEYEMTLRMAQEYTAGLPQEQEQLSVKEWKGKIRALGDVNVGAIEQYKEVKERFEFLTAQREDILAAEEKLRQIIEELSILMEQQFREQFKVISENFSEVFREMFGGGRAQLRLTDAAHVLESPIEIVAQPPGKNLQNMQLLSGGERALTAIAILFSILKMKPSPFCILDEIEAALDDANVSRYAQYLKKFAEETQFIVITHRKGTMEHADVLYGVTMQEKGISKLISVDFSEAEKSITA